MKFKRVCSFALTGIMALGAAFGSEISAYAAPEDWFRVDVSGQGNQQPSAELRNDFWALSYGYTIQPDYKYSVRVPDDFNEYTYHLAGYNEYRDYAYVDFEEGSFADTESIALWFTDSTQDSEFCIPEGEELIIWTSDETETGVRQTLASACILVYDKNGNLVDSFPMFGEAADNTTPAPTVLEEVPAPEVTEVTPDPTPAVVPVNPMSSDAVAQEIIKGKWGVGAERKIRLEQAGYDYEEVQKKVAELMK